MKQIKSLIIVFLSFLVVVLGTGAQADTNTRKNLMYSSYIETGVNVGTPGGLNLALGYWVNPLGVRISGISLNSSNSAATGASAQDASSINGIQLNIGYKLSDDTSASTSIALIGGTSNITYVSGSKLVWNYVGVAYNWQWEWLFAELGLTWGRGDYNNPQLVLQLGYMNRSYQL